MCVGRWWEQGAGAWENRGRRGTGDGRREGGSEIVPKVVDCQRSPFCCESDWNELEKSRRDQ